MKIMSVSDARSEFSEVTNRAIYLNERVALTRRGRIVAALIPVRDLERLERAEQSIKGGLYP